MTAIVIKWQQSISGVLSNDSGLLFRRSIQSICAENSECRCRWSTILTCPYHYVLWFFDRRLSWVVGHQMTTMSILRSCSPWSIWWVHINDYLNYVYENTKTQAQRQEATPALRPTNVKKGTATGKFTSATLNTEVGSSSSLTTWLMSDMLFIC